jgi:LCP family protein required for cell wall assembly
MSEPVSRRPDTPSAPSGVPGAASADPAVALARHGRLPRRSAVRTAITVAASALAVLLVSGGVVTTYAVGNLLGSVKPGVELASEDMLENVPDIGAMEGGLNFLLVGSDKRPASGAFGDPEEEAGVLNDVTMVLHISQDHSHVEVVSFPRDMLVDVPECPDPNDPANAFSARYQVKINTILDDGGLGCIASTVESMLGIKILVGGIVEFDGVAALSEAVGGVDVCVVDAIDDEYTGLKLDPGTHSLKGYEALAFLRTRHGVGDGSDLGRISSQQTFLASLARELQSSGTLADPIKLYSIAKAVLSNMTLSTGLQDAGRLVSIARAVADIDLSKIAFIQYPTTYLDDYSAVIPTESGSVIASALQQDVPVAFDPAATGNASYGTVDAGGTTEPTDAATPTEPAASATDAPATEAPATTAPSAALPGDVTGQTAAEVRCATANDD